MKKKGIRVCNQGRSLIRGRKGGWNMKTKISYCLPQLSLLLLLLPDPTAAVLDVCTLDTADTNHHKFNTFLIHSRQDSVDVRINSEVCNINITAHLTGKDFESSDDMKDYLGRQWTTLYYTINPSYIHIYLLGNTNFNKVYFVDGICAKTQGIYLTFGGRVDVGVNCSDSYFPKVSSDTYHPNKVNTYYTKPGYHRIIFIPIGCFIVAMIICCQRCHKGEGGKCDTLWWQDRRRLTHVTVDQHRHAPRINPTNSHAIPMPLPPTTTNQVLQHQTPYSIPIPPSTPSPGPQQRNTMPPSHLSPSTICQDTSEDPGPSKPTFFHRFRNQFGFTRLQE